VLFYKWKYIWVFFLTGLFTHFVTDTLRSILDILWTFFLEDISMTKTGGVFTSSKYMKEIIIAVKDLNVS